MFRESAEGSLFTSCMNVINSITHWVLGAVAMTVFIVAIISPGTVYFTQHLYTCTIGYVLMMAQAILSFNPNNGWSRNMRYEDKKVVHWVMQIVGAILAITGSILRILNRPNNFTTAHGILGLTAMILTFISLIGGVAGLYMKKTKITKIMHSCAGSLTVTCAFVCLCLGLDNTIVRGSLGNATADVAIGFTVVGLVGVLCSASFSSYNRIMNR